MFKCFSFLDVSRSYPSNSIKTHTAPNIIHSPSKFVSTNPTQIGGTNLHVLSSPHPYIYSILISFLVVLRSLLAITLVWIPNKFQTKMSPHANKITTTNALFPPPLKINKDSHFIKKPSSSSSSSSPPSSSSSSSTYAMVGSTTTRPPQQQRHPVIIYTHSPKIIHTHPRDFMALVQKLTGLSRFEDDSSPPPAKPEPPEMGNNNNNGMSSSLEEEMMNKSPNQVNNNNVMMRNDDNDSSSVITEENCSSISISTNNNNNSSNNNINNVGGGGGDSSSCFVPPNPYLANIPVFTPNATDFLCTNSINMFTTL